MTRNQKLIISVLMQTLLMLISIIDWSLFAQQILHLSLAISALGSGAVGFTVSRILENPCRRWVNNGYSK